MSNDKDKEALQRELQARADAVSLHAIINRSVGMLTVGVKSGAAFDGFSSWMMAGVGAIGGLLVVNMPALLPVLGADAVRVGVRFLVWCGVVGILAKLLYVVSESTRVGFDELRTIAYDEGRERGRETAHIEIEAEKQGISVQADKYEREDNLGDDEANAKRFRTFLGVHGGILNLHALLVIVQCGLYLGFLIAATADIGTKPAG